MNELPEYGLTIWWPWCTAIVAGTKRVENRGWEPRCSDLDHLRALCALCQRCHLTYDQQPEQRERREHIQAEIRGQLSLVEHGCAGGEL